MKPYLHKLFNVIISTGTYPGVWGEGFIVPIFKRGTSKTLKVIEALRCSVLLLNCLLLFLTMGLMIELKIIMFILKHRQVLEKVWARPTIFFILLGLISHCINNNEKLFVAFVEFQKALDYIVHDILWFKLVEIGVRGKGFNVITSFIQT